MFKQEPHAGTDILPPRFRAASSTTLSLMSSAAPNQAVVYKAAQANVVDGCMAGTINVTTRKPLAQKGHYGTGVSYRLGSPHDAPFVK